MKPSNPEFFDQMSHGEKVNILTAETMRQWRKTDDALSNLLTLLSVLLVILSPIVIIATYEGLW